jgi:hypothetical protein
MQHNLARPSPSISYDLPATHPDGIPLPNPNSVPDSTQDSPSAHNQIQTTKGQTKTSGTGTSPACARPLGGRYWGAPAQRGLRRPVRAPDHAGFQPPRAGRAWVAIAAPPVRRRANPPGFLGPGDPRWPAPGDLRARYDGAGSGLLWVLMG